MATASSKRLTAQPVVHDTSLSDTIQAAAGRGDAAWFERFIALGFSPLLPLPVENPESHRASSPTIETPMLTATVRWDPTGQVPLTLLAPFFQNPRARGDGLLVKHVQQVWTSAQQEGRPALLRGLVERLQQAPPAIQNAFLKYNGERADSFTEKFWRDHLRSRSTLDVTTQLPFMGPWISELRDWVIPEEWSSAHRLFGLYHTVRQQVRDGKGASLTHLWSLDVPIDAALLLAPVQSSQGASAARTRDAVHTAADLMDAIIDQDLDISGWTLGDAGPTLAAIEAGLPRTTPIISMLQDHLLPRAILQLGGDGVHRLQDALLRWERTHLMAAIQDQPLVAPSPRARL